MLTFITNKEDAEIRLEAGDDAGKAKWCNYTPSLPLFASHKLFINLAVKYLLDKGFVNDSHISFDI